jgi:APA family basic amino acid/polyamine antiporter
MFFQQLFARKSIDTLQAEAASDNEGGHGPRLRRILGPIQLTALGVGAIIGAGIFVMTGRVAAQDAGPAVMLSYVVAGVGCALAAFCYAEFASMAPVAGSAYTYAYATLGEIFAWIIGWDLILEYAMSCATVASAWSKYFNSFLNVLFHVQVPKELMNDPYTTSGAVHSWSDIPKVLIQGLVNGHFNLPAVLIMLFVTAVLVIGIRESATTNAILVAIKLGVVLFVIAVGFQYVNADNWTTVPVEARIPPKNPEEALSKWGLLGQLGINEWLAPIDEATRSKFAPYGFSGIMVGAALVFFAYIGFDSISAHSEEAKKPQRDVPIGIIASLVLCTALYLLVAAVITGMEPYPEINPDAAISEAFARQAQRDNSVLLRLSAGLIATGALAGMTSVLLITFLSQARIFLAMARDGLLPPSIFAAIHPKFRTPHISTMLTGALVCFTAAFTPIGVLEEMVNIGTLLAFVIVCAAVLLLRIRRPDAQRPFRCPAIYVVAPLGIVVNVIMMLFLPVETWLRLVVWLVLGLILYFCYGFWRSVMGKQLRGLIPAMPNGPAPIEAFSPPGKAIDAPVEPLDTNIKE